MAAKDNAFIRFLKLCANICLTLLGILMLLSAGCFILIGVQNPTYQSIT